VETRLHKEVKAPGSPRHYWQKNEDNIVSPGLLQAGRVVKGGLKEEGLKKSHLSLTRKTGRGILKAGAPRTSSLLPVCGGEGAVGEREETYVVGGFQG